MTNKLAQDAREMAGGFARGLTTDLLGAPVDLVSSIMRATGLRIPDEPKLGSSHLRRLTGQPAVDNPNAVVGNQASGMVNPLAGALKGLALAGTLFRPAPKIIEKALDLQKKGASQEEVFQATKAFPSASGRGWRTELDDDPAEFDKTFIQDALRGWKPDSPLRLEQIMTHPELFGKGAAGKSIREMELNILHDPKSRFRGAYNQNPLIGRRGENLGRIDLNMAHVDSPEKAMGTVLHEIGHGIQLKSDMQRGANPDNLKRRLNDFTLSPEQQTFVKQARMSGWDDDRIVERLYRGAPGEIEARLVQDRYRKPVRTTNPFYEYDVKQPIPQAFGD